MARIAIVGAGPAGSAAGWHLATRGHEVTLIDRAAFPRPKTCGDWITLGAVEELDRLGLTRKVIESSAGERAVITHTAIVSPAGRRTVNPSREPAYCIPRLVFDDMLWRHAVNAGCRPMQRTVRIDRHGRRRVPARVDARDRRARRARRRCECRGACARTGPCRRNKLSNAEASTVQIHYRRRVHARLWLDLSRARHPRARALQHRCRHALGRHAARSPRPRVLRSIRRGESVASPLAQHSRARTARRLPCQPRTAA